MVKVNLLVNAVTEATVAPAPKPVQATGQLFLILGTIVALVLAIGVDYGIVQSESTKAKKRLKYEQEAKLKLEDLKKQADEFKKKKDLVEGRLKIIKQLSAEQRGPVAILSNINDRLPVGVSLENIKQRGTQIIIDGRTTKKELVTEFAKQLERYSDGLFTNVDPTLEPGIGSQVADATEEAVIKFTIACTYNPPQSASTSSEVVQQSASK